MTRERSWIGLAAIIAFVGLLRWGLLDVPLERDEGEYAYTARLLLDGIPPYAQTVNMKLPGIYVAYAGILAVFGETPRAIHLGLLFVNSLTIGLVFLLGRRLWDESLGLIAAAAFAMLSASVHVQGLWANAEAFVLPFVLAGFVVLFSARERGRRRSFFGAGLLFGLAILMKQHGLFFAAAAGALLVLDALRSPTAQWRSHAARVGLLTAGTIFPYLLTCFVLWRAGVFDAFWFWTVEYAQAYATLVPLEEAPGQFIQRLAAVAQSGLLFWLVAALGLGAVTFLPRLRPKRDFVLLFAGASFVALLPGFYFRIHYFQLALPAIALLFALATRVPQEWMKTAEGGKVKRALPFAILGLALAQALFSQRPIYFEYSPDQVTRSMYGVSPFPESLIVGDFLRTSSARDDRIAILGSEPQIPFYAQRRKASSYLYMYPLMEDHPYAAEMQRQMIQQIEASRPRFLVFVNTVTSWQRQPNSRTEILTWLDGYIRTFSLVARVEIGPQGSRFFQREELSQASNCAVDCIEIFERLMQ